MVARTTYRGKDSSKIDRLVIVYSVSPGKFSEHEGLNKRGILAMSPPSLLVGLQVVLGAVSQNQKIGAPLHCKQNSVGER